MNLGLMASEDGGRIDYARLRDDRRRRLLDAMATAGLDALILGRPANIRYASGARQLWTSGKRPFGPGCVVVGDTGAVHLLSVWDEGVPPELPRANLFGLSWDPAHLLASLGAIPGLAGATRIGTDALTPLFAELLPSVAPRAALVDGLVVMRTARQTKTPDELACISTAVAIAEAGLAALIAALEPGVTERQLLGVLAEAVARLGAPLLASESVAFGTPRAGPVPFRQVPTDRPVSAGELVMLNPGVLHAGYEGGLGRTWIAGDASASRPQRQLAARGQASLAALLAACRAGRTGADVCRAWEEAGEPRSPMPLAYGVGLGVEPPVIGPGRGQTAELQEGAVLAVQCWVADEGAGGVFQRELVVVGSGEPRVLSRFGQGVAAPAR